METIASRRNRWAFAVLLVLGTAAVALSFPPPPPFLAVLTGGAGIAVLVAAGLGCGRSHGLGAPLFGHWSESGLFRRWLAVAISIGAASGAVLGAATLWWLRQPFVPGAAVVRARLNAESVLAPWKRWVISFDAAVLEEIGFRLFLVSAVAWLLARRWSPARRWTPAARVGSAVALSAVVFGTAHLPKWLVVAPFDTGMLASLFAVNALGGAVFGVVFRRWGIEAAIVSHFAADVVVRLLGPLVVGA